MHIIGKKKGGKRIRNDWKGKRKVRGNGAKFQAIRLQNIKDNNYGENEIKTELQIN